MARITEEQIKEMLRLRRQGKSITEIARNVGCQRQTVRAYLRERQGDILRDEARKQILVEAIGNHFKELADFGGRGMKQRFKESYSEKSSALRKKYFGGLLGLPGVGSPFYMVDEWERMYDPGSRANHLTEALREHAPDSPFWAHWKKWRNIVVLYELASRDIRDELTKKAEAPEVFLSVEYDYLASMQKWLFGNALREASGEPYEELKIVKRQDYEELVCGGTVVARPEDGKALYEHLLGIIKEPQALPSWSALQPAMAELEERQPELRRIAKDMDSALDALSMMYGFPGSCHLCPI